MRTRRYYMSMLPDDDDVRDIVKTILDDIETKFQDIRDALVIKDVHDIHRVADAYDMAATAADWLYS